MPYILPTLNLSCNIFTGPMPATYAALAPQLRLAGVPCQLRSRKDPTVLLAGFGGVVSAMELALPPGTDVRMQDAIGTFDIVEVPAGSKRVYTVGSVDDVAKGFANEYRVAGIQSDATLPGAWPHPYP